MSSTIHDLEREIRRHIKLYDAGTPEIPDRDYDALVEELRELAPQSPVLSTLGTVRTSHVITHRTPMLSLDKCYDDDSLLAWANGVDKASLFIVEPKYDGVSLALHYAKGRLVSAALRGNGIKGDNVINRVGLLVPQSLGNSTLSITIRGEVVLPRKKFEKYAKDFANPRNCIAGVIARKYSGANDPMRDAIFIAHDVVPEFPPKFSTLGGYYGMLETGGITTPRRTFADLPRLIGAREEMATLLAADTTGPEYDGIVIKLNDFQRRTSLGATDHHPRWAMAYKFQGQSGKTVIRHVLWQVSRRGVITPVACVDPVELSGVTVTRATLHNLSQMEGLGLAIEDEVLMTRRGGVIPHVESVTAEGANRRVIDIPKTCPSCESPLERRGGFLYCSKAEDCDEVRIGALVHFMRTCEIDGVGPEVAAALYKNKVVRTPIDFFRMIGKPGSAVELPPRGLGGGVNWSPILGAGVAGNLRSEIAAKLPLPANSVLAAIGINGLGSTLSRKLIKHYGSIPRVLDATEAELASLPGVGEKRAAEVKAGLEANRDLLEMFSEHNIIFGPSDFETAGASKYFAGKKVVFTGRMTDMDRTTAQKFVEEHGGEAPAGVTFDTTYLVVGDSAKEEQKTKREKAAKYAAKGSKIKIITEDEFVSMVAEALKSV